jgi:hypothetical protein
MPPDSWNNSLTTAPHDERDSRRTDVIAVIDDKH